MKITYDHKADALHIQLKDHPVVANRTVDPHFILDIDEFDEVCGIEILAVRQRGIDPLRIVSDYFTDDHQPKRPDAATIAERRTEIAAARDRWRARQTNTVPPNTDTTVR